MKKLVALFLVATMFAFATISINAVEFDDENYYDGDYEDYSTHISADGKYEYEYVYERTGGMYGVMIVNYTEKDNLPESYTLPEIIDNYSVVAIDSGAFSNSDNLKNVIIKQGVTIYSKAFNNCKNLKSVTLSETTELHTKAMGYNNGKKIPGFTVNCNSINYDHHFGANGTVYFAYVNNFKCNYNVKHSSKKTLKFLPGVSFTIKVDNTSATNWTSSNPKVVKVSSKGKVVALKKGTVTLKAKLKNGKSYSRKLKVVDNPTPIKRETEVTSVSVKKGKTVSVKLLGKANTINNSYKNTKTAKVISKKSASTIKIKGLKKGTTTLKITVNGKKLSLKVKVR